MESLFLVRTNDLSYDNCRDIKRALIFIQDTLGYNGFGNILHVKLIDPIHEMTRYIRSSVLRHLSMADIEDATIYMKCIWRDESLESDPEDDLRSEVYITDYSFVPWWWNDRVFTAEFFASNSSEL